MLILVMGLPGSGKTTFASAFAKEIGAVHLNTDRIRRELDLRGQYDPDSKRRVYQCLLKRAADLLAAGRKVVLDATFHRSRQRQEAGALASKRHLPVYWIELTAAEQAIRDRVSRQRPDSEADWEVYLQLKRTHEPLEIPHLILDSGRYSPRELVQIAVNYLHTQISSHAIH